MWGIPLVDTQWELVTESNISSDPTQELDPKEGFLFGSPWCLAQVLEEGSTPEPLSNLTGVVPSGSRGGHLQIPWHEQDSRRPSVIQWKILPRVYFYVRAWGQTAGVTLSVVDVWVGFSKKVKLIHFYPKLAQYSQKWLKFVFLLFLSSRAHCQLLWGWLQL